MLRTLLVIIVAICILSVSGCGTFSDAVCGPSNDDVFYRGVRLDVQAAKEGGAKVLMVADIPFSMVADTLFVPYLAYHELTDPPRKSMQFGADESFMIEKTKTEAIPQVTPEK